ncbi:glycosyltransferase family 2 protein [Planctomicrobium sp. SH668]|uniref:glycosyltransferase family 2 protein n=1 Tax=Planctomicrobium sp. SH668 TaxID=3448126 RepID=UPI003F5C801E
MNTISVIVPQYGNSHLTLAAVKSLQRHHSSEFEIVIVDDGSDDEQRSQVHEEASGNVQLLRLPHRRGVTVAWNAGALGASGEILIFLNNDTVTHGRWVDQISEAVSSSGEYVIAGTDWRFDPLVQNGRRHILSGYCLAIRKSCFERIGRFDERFRLYYSDTDLQCRLLLANPTALIGIESLPLKHSGHQTSKFLPQRRRVWESDRLAFQKKMAIARGV